MMIEEHLEESKKQLRNLADRIFLNEEDLAINNSPFAPLIQKSHNVILSDHLVDLANSRIEDLEIYITEENKIEQYKDHLIEFLRELIAARI